MTIGERIKAARKDVGVTQAQLASCIGLTKAAISKYENGRRDITVDLLKMISSALDVPVASLLGENTGWCQVTLSEPKRFYSVLGTLVGQEPFPAVREVYRVDDGFFCPALDEPVKVSAWMPMPEGYKP